MNGHAFPEGMSRDLGIPRILVQDPCKMASPPDGSQGGRVEDERRDGRGADAIAIQIMPQRRAIAVTVSDHGGIGRVVLAKDDFVGFVDGRRGFVVVVCGKGRAGVDDGRE